MKCWTEADVATLREMNGSGADDTAIAIALDRTRNSVNLKRNALGLPGAKAGPVPMPIPDDFREHALKTCAELSRMYGYGRNIIARFRRELGIKKVNQWLEPKPKKEKRAKTPKTPRGSKTKGGYWCNEIPQLGGAEIDRAKLHLQRAGYRPVVKAEYSGKKAPPGHYLVGALVMAPHEMIALAVSKGFDADEWKRAA